MQKRIIALFLSMFFVLPFTALSIFADELSVDDNSIEEVDPAYLVNQSTSTYYI